MVPAFSLEDVVHSFVCERTCDVVPSSALGHVFGRKVDGRSEEAWHARRPSQREAARKCCHIFVERGTASSERNKELQSQRTILAACVRKPGTRRQPRAGSGPAASRPVRSVPPPMKCALQGNGQQRSVSEGAAVLTARLQTTHTFTPRESPEKNKHRCCVFVCVAASDHHTLVIRWSHSRPTEPWAADAREFHEAVKTAWPS